MAYAISSCECYRIQGQSLSYNSLAHKEWRNIEGSCSDVCMLYVARAYIVDTSVSTDDDTTSTYNAGMLMLSVNRRVDSQS